MDSVKTTFQDRASEIEKYFVFINAYIPSSTNDDLNKILKSNLLLMLYNLVESSVSNAVEEIHNDIHSQGVSFDTLKTEIKQVLIRHLKKHMNPKHFVASINSIAIDIVKRSFDKEKIFSGNVDGRKIRELADDYGFSSRTTYASTKDGNCLLAIKGRRNDLAHGVYSFTEVGKDYSVQDLENMKNEAINYLTEILDNVQTYLNNRDYLQNVI